MVKGLSPRRLCIRARSSQTAALAFLSASRTGCFDVNYWIFFFFTFSARTSQEWWLSEGETQYAAPSLIEDFFLFKNTGKTGIHLRLGYPFASGEMSVCLHSSASDCSAWPSGVLGLILFGCGRNSEGSKRLGGRERDGEGGEGWNWEGKAEAEVKRCDNCLLFVSFSC